MIRLVAIDFDDTLCLTESDQYRLENLVLKDMGYEPMSRTVHLKNWGVPLQRAIEERVPGIDSGDFMKRFAVATLEAVKLGESDVVSDINMQTLDVIRSRGIKTAILTSRTIGEAKHLMDVTHPLSSKIDAFYHKESSAFSKPDPRVFDIVLRDFNVAPHEAAYVGDSIGDAEATKGAGMHFIALLESGLRPTNYFDSQKVDFFAQTFPDILKYVLQDTI